MSSDHKFFSTAVAARVQHQTAAPIIAVKYKERGFYPIYPSFRVGEGDVEERVARLNEPHGWTPEEVESAVFASCFGWDKPIAELARKAVERYEAANMPRLT